MTVPSLLPDTDRVLLGPGPSLTAPRVMRAMASPTLSHLDPQFMRLLDDIRARLGRVFRAADGSFAFAVSGTGTSGMETTVANLVKEGTRATVVVSGYFGDRLAQMCERYGATVTRLNVEWGRACDPDALRQQLKSAPADIVCLVHAETSTGVVNPVRELAAIAREQGALTIADTVTSLGGMPLDVGAWGIDAAYSCTQKCLGGPSGLSPVVFGPRALAQRVKCRSFYFDLSLLEDYWLRRNITTRCRRRWSTPCTRRCRSSKRKGSTRAGRGTSGTIARWSRRWRRSACRCCRRKPIACGRSTPSACPTASTKPPSASTCSKSSISRSAPGSVRWPARSGASD
jgi:aspartate aminotransferase-like enzyme